MTREEFTQQLAAGHTENLQNYRVKNAIILAAGFASRFAPLSYTTPKALLKVRGEVLIERQIRQLQAAGISEIHIVVGYKKEQFAYLEEKFGVHLIENSEYATKNNHSSIYAARKFIDSSYICSSDNYFMENVFSAYEYQASYSALYADGKTDEYCLSTAPDGRITEVVIGGHDAWYMLGHVYWSPAFSRKFLAILEEVYDLPQTRDLLWEKIYMQHLDELAMYIHKYPSGVIQEFDNLDELCVFDPSYLPYRNSLQTAKH